MSKLSGDQFRNFLVQHLGPESPEPYGEKDHPLFDKEGMPRFHPERVEGHVFRTMSEEHYQRTLKEGVHYSDERGNYIGQAKSDPETWKDMTPEPEGTVAGRWAYPGYIMPGQVGRVAKIRVHQDDAWEPHPHDDEGGYVRTFKKIPADRIEAVTPKLRATQGYQFEVLR